MTRIASPKPNAAIYQLKITLRGSKPPIWRRILVPADVTLAVLSIIIQTVMEWGGGHMHLFTIGEDMYGEPMQGEDNEDILPEGRVKLSKAAPDAGCKFLYTYDFGDDWEHLVVVEKILTAEAGKKYPVCVAGKRAAPPDDCGGIWGYEELLETLADPKHPEHKSMLEWAGKIDPEYFDREEINQWLANRFS